MKTLLKGGQIVTEGRIFKGDVLLKVGKILKVGNIKDWEENTRIYNVGGMYILPGLIDAHVHFTSKSVVDDVEISSIAAARGGVTTFIDYVYSLTDCSIGESISHYIQDTKPKSAIDFTFHYVLLDLTEKIENELIAVNKYGMNSLKIYTTFRDIELFPQDKLDRLFHISKKHKLLLTVHAEDDELILKLENEFAAEGKTDIKYFSEVRPTEAESRKILEVGRYAKKHDVPFYIVHLSSRKGLNAVRQLRNEGVKVYVETRPIYLLITHDGKDMEKIKRNLMVPPLRKQEDLDELWEGIISGEIQTIASDQFGTSVEKKKKNMTIENWTPGGASVEIMLPLIHHYGVNKNRLNYVQMAKLLSTNPAKIFGLYPQKGSIMPGSDADLVVFDPDKEHEITIGRLHTKTGYTPFEGRKIKGWPVMTFLRGELIAHNGQFCGTIGSGEFVKCKGGQIACDLLE